MAVTVRQNSLSENRRFVVHGDLCDKTACTTKRRLPGGQNEKSEKVFFFQKKCNTFEYSYFNSVVSCIHSVSFFQKKRKTFIFFLKMHQNDMIPNILVFAFGCLNIFQPKNQI